jgi:hypothetical protein
MSESKFATFITEKKLNVQRILSVSHKLETLRPEDRKIRLEKRQAKKAEGGEKKQTAKPRSGRPVTPRAIEAAMAGKALTGPQKQRILRAFAGGVRGSGRRVRSGEQKAPAPRPGVKSYVPPVNGRLKGRIVFERCRLPFVRRPRRSPTSSAWARSCLFGAGRPS